MGESYSDERCSVFSTTCPLASRSPALIPVCLMKSVVFCVQEFIIEYVDLLL